MATISLVESEVTGVIQQSQYGLYTYLYQSLPAYGNAGQLWVQNTSFTSNRDHGVYLQTNQKVVLVFEGNTVSHNWGKGLFSTRVSLSSLERNTFRSNGQMACDIKLEPTQPHTLIVKDNVWNDNVGALFVKSYSAGYDQGVLLVNNTISHGRGNNQDLVLQDLRTVSVDSLTIEHSRVGPSCAQHNGNCGSVYIQSPQNADAVSFNRTRLHNCSGQQGVFLWNSGAATGEQRFENSEILDSFSSEGPVFRLAGFTPRFHYNWFENPRPCGT